MATMRDLTQRMEELYEDRQEALENAEWNEARGFTTMAKLYRRKAAGKLAAYNTMAKQLEYRGEGR